MAQFHVDRIVRGARQIITAPSKRDLQVRLGPSDIAHFCDHCLGQKMAGKPPQREFSLYPWLGTAIHTLIEKLISPGVFAWIPGINDIAWELFGIDGKVHTELHVEHGIFIPGYGWCPANVDLFLENEGTLVDWKSSSIKKVKSYRVSGNVPIEYVGQVLLYMHALRQLGYNVLRAVLVFIPRDTATPDDIWGYEVEYSEVAVQQLVDRAAVIQQWVDGGVEDQLDKHPDCWTCNPRSFFR